MEMFLCQKSHKQIISFHRFRYSFPLTEFSSSHKFTSLCTGNSEAMCAKKPSGTQEGLLGEHCSRFTLSWITLPSKLNCTRSTQLTFDNLEGSA